MPARVRLNVDFSGGTYDEGWSAVLFGGTYASSYSGDFAEVTTTGLADGLTALFDVGTMTLTVGVAVLEGDANGDGAVDAADYVWLKSHFGLSGAAAEGADLDGLGTVDFADLQILMDALNPAPEAPTAPEPATLGLLAIGALAVIRGRRARL